MIGFGIKITKNFALDLNLLYFFRNFSDGIDWFKFEINSDWFKGDHNPQFSMCLIILNLMLFDFQIYNIHHLLKEE